MQIKPEVLDVDHQLVKPKANLPSKVEDLHKFIVIGEEVIRAHKAQLNAIKKADVAKDYYEIKLQDGQKAGELVLDAKVKLGEILEGIKPKYVGSTEGTHVPKQIKTLPENITKKQSHQLQEIARNPDVVEEIKEEARKNDDVPTSAMALKKIHKKKIERNTENTNISNKDEDAKHPHVAKNRGNYEWYTPEDIAGSAKTVLGDIDLDPASSDIANKIIGAKKYYTKEDNGLSQVWSGCVYMNPPYAGELIGRFIDKLCESFDSGTVEQAIVLVNNATETNWFQRLTGLASGIVFPSGRVKFTDPDGKPGAPLQGQAVLYLGGNKEVFFDAFSKFGIALEVRIV